MTLLFGMLSSDTIYLRNGKTLEGIILRQSEKEMVVDIGFGTTTLVPGDVLKIVKATAAQTEQLKEKWRQDYFDHDLFVPAGCKDLMAEYRELERFRSMAVSENRRINTIADRYRNADEELQRKEAQYLETAALLKNASPEADRYRYNRLVVESNKLHSELTILRNDKKTIENELQQGTGAISDYLQALSKFEKAISAAMARQKGASEQMDDFLRRLRKKLKDFQKDFRETAIQIPASGGRSIVLPVSINNRIIGKFLMDTGASLVSLSAAFARRAGIALHDIEPVEAVLADGRSVPAKPVTLQSVKVGDESVENVKGLVMDNPPYPGIDGLLGMSYLGNFLFYVDGNSKKLVLKRFTAE